ncbi:hypothetical protein B0H13DRAFT_1907261 [Mycena leptocephala]|nr:hypothetical protein B0H13DRAFT_1907261 [Mycena leptocephala]
MPSRRTVDLSAIPGQPSAIVTDSGHDLSLAGFYGPEDPHPREGSNQSAFRRLQMAMTGEPGARNGHASVQLYAAPNTDKVWDMEVPYVSNQQIQKELWKYGTGVHQRRVEGVVSSAIAAGDCSYVTHPADEPPPFDISQMQALGTTIGGHQVLRVPAREPGGESPPSPVVEEELEHLESEDPASSREIHQPIPTRLTNCDLTVLERVQYEARQCHLEASLDAMAPKDERVPGDLSDNESSSSSDPLRKARPTFPFMTRESNTNQVRDLQRLGPLDGCVLISTKECMHAMGRMHHRPTSPDITNHTRGLYYTAILDWNREREAHQETIRDFENQDMLRPLIKARIIIQQYLEGVIDRVAMGDEPGSDPYDPTEASWQPIDVAALKVSTRQDTALEEALDQISTAFGTDTLQRDAAWRAGLAAEVWLRHAYVAHIIAVRALVLDFLERIERITTRRRWVLDLNLLHYDAIVPPPYLTWDEYARMRLFGFLFAGKGHTPYRFKDAHVIAHFWKPIFGREDEPAGVCAAGAWDRASFFQRYPSPGANAQILQPRVPEVSRVALDMLARNADARLAPGPLFATTGLLLLGEKYAISWTG